MDNNDTKIVKPENDSWRGLEVSFANPTLLGLIADFLHRHSISGIVAVGTLSVMGLAIWNQSGGWATAICVMAVSFGTFAMLFTERKNGKDQGCPDELGDASTSPAETRKIE